MLLRPAHARISDQYSADPSPEIPLIANASALHDIGKIIHSVETILNKPGKLTPEEFELIMKTHSEASARTSWTSTRYYPHERAGQRTARQICRWHHERYDGQRLPQRARRATTSPSSAQAVALADVYDALTQRARATKKPLTHEYRAAHDLKRRVRRLQSRC